jgi:hypothetical protein
MSATVVRMASACFDFDLQVIDYVGFRHVRGPSRPKEIHEDLLLKGLVEHEIILIVYADLLHHFIFSVPWRNLAIIDDRCELRHGDVLDTPTSPTELRRRACATGKDLSCLTVNMATRLIMV